MTDTTKLAAWEVSRGDSLQLLKTLDGDSVDAVVTDPPYSSGGAFRSDRNVSPLTKYVKGEVSQTLPDFHGDNRSERAMLAWCSQWMGEAWRVTRTGGAIAVFTDWRMLPTMSDALQVAGWTWRGVGSWVKPPHRSRPLKGGLRNQTEFVLWGSKGPRTEGDCLPGSWMVAAPDSRIRLHPTEKPQEVLGDLVRLAPEGGTVLDPFMGSASTGLAAITRGRRFWGFELSEDYVAIAEGRLRDAERQG